MGWTTLTNDNKEIIGIVGDEAWDIIGAALDELVKCYKERFNRVPNKVELEQILNFTRPKELQHLKIECHQFFVKIYKNDPEKETVYTRQEVINGLVGWYDNTEDIVDDLEKGLIPEIQTSFTIFRVKK